MRGWAALFFCATGLIPLCAHADPNFVDVANSTGLIFDNPYGVILDAGPAQSLNMNNIGNGVAVGDYDNDGDLDVYFCANNSIPNVLYQNQISQGSKSFVDVSVEAGVAHTGLSRIAHFVDLDNDGWLDLLVINDDDTGTVYAPSRVYRNNQDGTFTDVTTGSGFSPPGYIMGGAALADYDQDGLVDVFVTMWAMSQSGNPLMPGENRMYRNTGNFKFQDTSVSLGLSGVRSDCFTSLFSDFDNDKYPDIYIAIDHHADLFYFNENGTSFIEVSEEIGADHTFNDMGACLADFDDDGDLDMYATNITDPLGQFGQGGVGRNVFYINQQSQNGGFVEFVDEATERGVEDTYWGWGVDFVDVDNDGDLDIFAATGFNETVEAQTDEGVDHPLYNSPNVLFINDGTGYFERVYPPALDVGSDSRALVVFDYDRDGDQDVLIGNQNQPVMLFENQTPSLGNSLYVSVRQKAGLNRFGLGATASCKLGSVTKRREFLAATSYMTGAPAEVHFGLGSTSLIDLLSIEWTDGTVTDVPNVPADQYLTIDQENPIEPVPTSVTIDGPKEVEPDSVVSFTASATFYYAYPGNVTSDVEWSVNPSDNASFTAPGQLTIAHSDEPQALLISASLQGVAASYPVTLQVDGGVDVEPPVVTIESPSSSQPFVTAAEMVLIEGTATDDVAVESVVWANDHGESGDCEGTSAFSCGPITLANGQTMFTVTAHDSNGNGGAATLEVVHDPAASEPGQSPGLPSLSPALALSGTAFYFGDDVDEIELRVWNTGMKEQSYTLSANKSWVKIEPGEGIARNVLDFASHMIVIDRSKLLPIIGQQAVITLTPDDPEMSILSVNAFATGAAIANQSPDDTPDDPTDLPPNDVPTEQPIGNANDNSAGDPVDHPDSDNENSSTGDDVAPQRGMCGAMGLVSSIWLIAGLALLGRSRRRPPHVQHPVNPEV